MTDNNKLQLKFTKQKVENLFNQLRDLKKATNEVWAGLSDIKTDIENIIASEEINKPI